ncbi:asparaginase [Chromobacterium vaccinii]|uniref:asparaginase n=1 Tax=Chromobacterium vaccinii TaxID=1108595 RepID=UPI001E38903E|nr:asparaginase [Chromobacterium vaccinii]MCD4483864.1 asparaginase [Chromobacterium vaccinii]
MDHADALPPAVLVMTTGGTIAMRAGLNEQAPVPALGGRELLQLLRMPLPGRVLVEEVFNLPSDEMGPEQWRSLHARLQDALARHDICGVVITHGTDTVEETAWFLELTTKTEKPVILLGAQRDASRADSDGPRNLHDGIRLAFLGSACGKGVMLIANGEIHGARWVAKSHTSNVMGFCSGEVGALGRIEDSSVQFFHSAARRSEWIPLLDAVLPKVEIVVMYGGADGSMIRRACESGARGVVVQALGRGNVNQAMLEAIQDAMARGIAVAISSRVGRGRVAPHYGFPGGGLSLKEAGAVFCEELSPQKARILLMLALQREQDPTRLDAYFSRILALS